MASLMYNLSGGYKIPAVGFGTFTVTDEKELENALNAALETGYRHIDTAFYYQNEHIIGKVLKKWFDAGKLKRKDIFITTKLHGYGVHPDRVERYLKQSLEKLQLAYVDLYLIHFPICVKEIIPGESPKAVPEPTDLIGTWKKLEEQVDLGRTKTIGLSNCNENQVGRIIASSRIKPVVNQIELHIYLQQPELVKYCQDNGVVVVSYASLGNPGRNKWLEKQGLPTRQREIPLDNPTVKLIADKHNKSAAQVLLKFWIQKKVAVIPKSITAKRIKDNYNLFDFTLDANDIKSLEGLNQGNETRITRLDFSPEFLTHPEYPFAR